VVRYYKKLREQMSEEEESLTKFGQRLTEQGIEHLTCAP